MIERYELELNDPEAGCSFTKTEDGDLCVYADVKKLEDENKDLKKRLKAQVEMRLFKEVQMDRIVEITQEVL